MERRFIDAGQLTLDTEGEDAGRIVGRIPYMSLSEDLGGFRERINPAAFIASLSDGSEVWSYFNHNRNEPLGKRSKGSVRLRHADNWLSISVAPPNTSWGRDSVEAVRSELADGFSFGFNVRKDTWSNEGGVRIRELLDVELVEVSPVYDAAYKGSSVALRSMLNVVAPEVLEQIDNRTLKYYMAYQRQREAECSTN